MKKITLIAAAVAAFGLSSQANAFVSGNILFDRDGSGAGASAITVSSFDWLPGNVLAQDSIGAVSGPFTTYYQAKLNSFVTSIGGSTVSTSPLAGTEFTVQAVFQEVGVTGGTTANFASLAGGTYTIFYDATADANDATGNGYGDGIAILSGSILAGGAGTFTNNTLLARDIFSQPLIDPMTNPAGAFFQQLLRSQYEQYLVPTGLDSSGTSGGPEDFDGGVLSHFGGGNSTIFVDVQTLNRDFFITDVSTLEVDLGDTTELTAPFLAANPSDTVVGQTPIYGYEVVDGVLQQVNGAACRDGTATCDFHFQSDSSTTFAARTVPEPGSLAIAGAGLALMSLIRRRKSK